MTSVRPRQAARWRQGAPHAARAAARAPRGSPACWTAADHCRRGPLRLAPQDHLDGAVAPAEPVGTGRRGAPGVAAPDVLGARFRTDADAHWCERGPAA